MVIKKTRTAIKNLRRIDAPYQSQLEQAIAVLPKGSVKKMKNQGDDYRLRVGKYRVLFSMNESEIIIHTIKPRGDAYKQGAKCKH